LHQLLIQFDKEGTASPLFCYRYFMDLGEKIKEIAQQLLVNPSLFIVNISVSSLSGPQKVTISLDGDNGVTIDDCADLSRQLLDRLEEEGLIGDNFTLEVTTPGTDKPLKLKRQFAKNTGRLLKLHLTDKKIAEGKLVALAEDNITLEIEKGEGKKKELSQETFSFESIEKAFVQISFK
jgi:ribosome maturation factor RimP